MPNATQKPQTEASYTVPGVRITRSSIDGLELGQKPIPDTFYVGARDVEYGPDCVVIDEIDRVQEVNNWRGVAIRFIKERLKDSPRVQAPILRPKCLHVYTGVVVVHADCIIEAPRISGAIKAIEVRGNNLKIEGAAGHLYGGDRGVEAHEYIDSTGLDVSNFRIGYNLLAHGNQITGGKSHNCLEHGSYTDGQTTFVGYKVVVSPPHDTWLEPKGITFTKRANFSSDVGGMMSVPFGSIGLDVVGAHCLTVQRTITCTNGGVALRLREGASDGNYDLTICGVGAPAKIDVSGAGTGNAINVTSGTTQVEVIGRCHESNIVTVNREVRKAA